MNKSKSKKLKNMSKMSRNKLTWLSCILSFLIVCSVSIAASMAWFTGQDIINGMTTVVGTSELSWRNSNNDIVSSFNFSGELEPDKSIDQVLDLVSLGTVADSYLRVLVETKLDNDVQNVLEVVKPVGFDENWIKRGNYYYYLGGAEEDVAILTSNMRLPFATGFKLSKTLTNSSSRRILDIKIVAETLEVAGNAAELTPWEDAPNEWLIATGKKATMRSYTFESALFNVSDIAYSYNDEAGEYLVYTPTENNTIKIRNIGVNPHILSFDFVVNYYNAENVLIENARDIVGFTYTATDSTENAKGKVFVKQDIATGVEYTITINKLYIKVQGSEISNTENTYKVGITTNNDIVAIAGNKAESYSSYADLPGDFVYDDLRGTLDHYVSVTNDVARKEITIENNSLLANEDITITNLGEKPVALVFEIMTNYYSFENSVLTKYAISSNPVSLTYDNEDTIEVSNGYLYLGTLAKNEFIKIDNTVLNIAVPNTIDAYYDVSVSVLSYVFDTVAPENPFPATQEVPNEWFRAVNLKAPFDLTIANGSRVSNEEIVYVNTDGSITIENLGQQTAVYSLWFGAETSDNSPNDVEITLNDENFYHNEATDRYYYYGSLASEAVYNILQSNIDINYNTTNPALTTIKVFMDAKPLTPSGELFNAELPAKWYRSIGRTQEIDVTLGTNGVEYVEKAPITESNSIVVHNYGTASIAYYVYFEESDNGSLSAVLNSDEYISNGIASAKNYFYVGLVAPNGTNTIEYSQLSGQTSNTLICIKCVKYDENSNPFGNEVSVPNSWLRAMDYPHTLETIVEVTSTDSSLKNVAVANNATASEATVLTNVGDYDALFYVEFQVDYQNDIAGEVSVKVTDPRFIESEGKYYYNGTLNVDSIITIQASAITYSNETAMAGEQFRIIPEVTAARKDGANNPFASAPYKWLKDMGFEYEEVTIVEVTSTDSSLKNVAVANNATASESTVLTNVGDYDALFYVEFQVDYQNDIAGEVSVKVTDPRFIESEGKYYYNGTLNVDSSITILASAITYSNETAMAGEQFRIIPEVTAARKDGANNPFASAPYKWLKDMNLNHTLETIVEVTATDESARNIMETESSVSEPTIISNVGDYDALFYVEFQVEYLNGYIRDIDVRMTNDNFTESGEKYERKYYYNRVLNANSVVTILANQINYEIASNHSGEQFKIVPIITFAKKDGTNNPFANSPNEWATAVGVDNATETINVNNYGTSIIAFTSLPVSSNTIEFANASENDIIYRVSYVIEYYKNNVLVDNVFEEMITVSMPSTFTADENGLYFYYKGKGTEPTVSFTASYAQKDGAIIPATIDSFKIVYDIETKEWDESKSSNENAWQFPSAPNDFYTALGAQPFLSVQCTNNNQKRSLPNIAVTESIPELETIRFTNNGANPIIVKFRFFIEYYNSDNSVCVINENIATIIFDNVQFVQGVDSYYYFKHTIANGQSITFNPSSIVFTSNAYENKDYRLRVQYYYANYNSESNSFEDSAPENWFENLTALEG